MMMPNYWLVSNKGYQHTLRVMNTLRGEWKKSPVIHEVAAQCVRGVPQDDTMGVIDAVYRWMRLNVRYTHDPVNLETVRSPQETIRLGMGDCDDMAILGAAILESVGVQTDFMALGYSSSRVPEHVICSIFFDGDHIACMDCTLDTRYVSPLDSCQFIEIWGERNGIFKRIQ